VLQEGLQTLVEKTTTHKLLASASRSNRTLRWRDNHCNTA